MLAVGCNNMFYNLAEPNNTKHTVMKTKVFKLTDSNFATYQAIANVDAGGKVYVHYINAFEVSCDDINESIVNHLANMVEKWATKQGYTMWSF